MKLLMELPRHLLKCLVPQSLQIFWPWVMSRPLFQTLCNILDLIGIRGRRLRTSHAFSEGTRFSERAQHHARRSRPFWNCQANLFYLLSCFVRLIVSDVIPLFTALQRSV